MSSLKYYGIIVNYFIRELLVHSSKPQLYFCLCVLKALTIIFQLNYFFVIRKNETQISVFNSSTDTFKSVLASD
jgi:hypothetical protein